MKIRKKGEWEREREGRRLAVLTSRWQLPVWKWPTSLWNGPPCFVFPLQHIFVLCLVMQTQSGMLTPKIFDVYEFTGSEVLHVWMKHELKKQWEQIHWRAKMMTFIFSFMFDHQWDIQWENHWEQEGDLKLFRAFVRIACKITFWLFQRKRQMLQLVM